MAVSTLASLSALWWAPRLHVCFITLWLTRWSQPREFLWAGPVYLQNCSRLTLTGLSLPGWGGSWAYKMSHVPLSLSSSNHPCTCPWWECCLQVPPSLSLWRPLPEPSEWCFPQVDLFSATSSSRSLFTVCPEIERPCFLPALGALPRSKPWTIPCHQVKPATTGPCAWKQCHIDLRVNRSSESSGLVLFLLPPQNSYKFGKVSLCDLSLLHYKIRW